MCRRLATAAAEITRPSPQDAESVGARSLGTGEERRRQELGVQAPPLDLLPRLLDHLHTVPGTGSDSYSPPQPDLAGDRRRRARRRAAAWRWVAGHWRRRTGGGGGAQQRGGGWRRTGGVGGVVLVGGSFFIFSLR